MSQKPIKDEVQNPTVDRQILHQLSVSNGRYNKRVLSDGDTSPEGEEYGWIQFLADTALSAITDLTIVPAEDQTTALIGSYLANQTIPGRFTDITVTTGTVLCYTNQLVE